MGRKGERTRAMVVERAAALFNSRGYHGCSITEVLKATGLEKGGLYNHFGSKDALAIEAFDYTVGVVERRFADALEGVHDAGGRLMAIVEAFAKLVTEPEVAGGCPVMNTAVEAADTHPALFERARRVMDRWHGLIAAIVEGGIRRGEIDPAADPAAVASVLTSCLEGAVLLSKLYDDPAHMEVAVRHLRGTVGGLRTIGAATGSARADT